MVQQGKFEHATWHPLVWHPNRCAMGKQPPLQYTIAINSTVLNLDVN